MPSLADLLHALPDAQVYANIDPATVDIQQITADNRTITPGALFVALQGRQVDGHHFIGDATNRGALAVVGTLSPSELAQQGRPLPAHLPYVQVKNSRLALATCCAVFYHFPSRALTVIGVTGTDGKTTTSSLLEAILAVATRENADDAGRVGVITTVGAKIRGEARDTGLHVTTPDAPEVQHFLAQMREAGCVYAVVESTSHGLNQERVAAVDFDLAAVTNITHEHLDEHGTREAYVAAKAKLFRALYTTPVKPGVPRCAVLNADDEGSFGALQTVLAEEAAQHGPVAKIHTYGLANAEKRMAQTADVTATDVAYFPDRTAFTVRWWGGEFGLETPLIGDFNVYNVLCATTVALALGIDPARIQMGVAHFSGVLGRMQRIDEGQAFLALVDFAHTPVSLERALLTLRPLVGHGQLDGQGRLIAVFGSAGLRDRAKRRLMGQVSGRLADFTVITAEDPRTEDVNEINAAIAAGVREFADEHAFTIIADRTQAIQWAVELAGPGDVVAAFGKGHERSMCFGTTEYPWSDQQALADALRIRGLRR
ncbi:MAG: UDP-N-acetylmuramoyl-L-alanyl-D-glutamate--2,6-diaminopimelate ligase [Chloroflexi bacterium]|nr:UDP-N-acetylmuramoyl-L-alanyl-D-glutamate--2,6-diaminopimelate ligase [Chloroflexota bacterium]